MNGVLTSSYANAFASSSRVTLESKDDKRVLRKPSRGKLLPWSRRGKKSASAEHVKDGPDEENEFRDHPVYGGRSLSTSPGGSEEALETQLERLMIPTPWPCEDRPENCPSITSVPPYKTRTFYRLHSPAGPPYYINHLLRPPNSSALFAAQSPGSAFSNSFPPLAALPPGSPPLRTITLSLRARPDQQHPPLQASQSSPNNVSLTPSSSSNIGFAGASDVSYFNRDNYTAVGSSSADVDHLDVSSPWGQKFHHDSPYDLGQKKGKKAMRPGGPSASTSATDLRSRLPSHSRFSRPTTPSPLSQSTPAVNTQPERKEVFGPRRKLSKRKPSGLQAPPTPDSSSDSQHSTPSPVDQFPPESAVSMTSTAVPRDIPSASAEGVNSTTSFQPDLSRKLSKRRPIQFHSASSGYISSPEKNKGGVFGRMAKRFSFGMGNFMSGGKRGMTFERRLGHKGSISLTDVSFNGRLSRPQNEPPTVIRNEPPPQASQPESQKQGPKRIPPPSLEELPSASSVSVSQTSISVRKSIVAPTPGPSVAPQLPNIVSDTSFALMSQQFQEGAVRDSLVSTDTEPNWSLGKLTIANPDMAGGSDTDTSFRGKRNNLMSTSRLPDRPLLVDPDPRASIRVEVDSRSSFQDLGDRNSRAFTTESRTPTQEPMPLHQQGSQGLVPPPPPKEERMSTVSNETPITQNLRVSVTESSATATSRPSSRASSPDLPPTPPDTEATPPNFVPPTPVSKNTEVPPQTILLAQDNPPNKPIASDRSNLSNADSPSPTKSRPNGRQEHVYIVDVPVDGSLFVRSAPDGVSVPPIEKPELPPLPPKSDPQGISTPAPAPSSSRQSKDQKETTPPPAPSSSRQQSKDRKETTIFTSLFNTPRGRHTSESPPTTEGSSHDHGSQISPSVARRRTKPSSPDKSSSAVHRHADSPEKDSHRDRVRDRDHYGSRRGDRRSYLEKRDDHREPTTLRDVHNRSHSEGSERRERERRQEHEERQIREREQEKEKERHRQRLKEEDERVARKRREREEEESRANRAKEREEEERRERKARERDEEQRRLRRAKEREEEEARLKRIKQREEDERRAKEDEERRARKAKEREEEERRIRREKERAEEERRVRREREDQERKARKIKEEEDRRKAKEEEERRRMEEEEMVRVEERRRAEEERRKRKEDEEKRARREEEEKRRARKEEEERRARKEEEERRARKEEEERRARKEEEERRARKEEEERRARREEDKRARREEEERRARREEEERRAKEEEKRRAREEEERRAREEEERRAREEEEDRRAERSVRKQREKEELQRAARKEQERLEAEEERERKERRALEREAIRQREWELEQRHQEGHSWSQETMRSFHSISGDRPTTLSYPSMYSSTVGYDWEPVEQQPHRKQRSHDSHDPGRQVRNHKEPARLPDYHRRVELGIYPPGSSSHSSSSHFRRPRAVSLESASQPPTPPRKEKEYTLRRQQINGGHAYPSMTVDDTIFTRPHPPIRPVSGFPSPDVFKAREAWEHDRIWRGQSMSFDTGSAVSGSLPPASWTDLHSYSYEPSIPPSVSYYSPPPPGSSYTSFMVQPSWSYPHYQTAPPPPPIEPFSIPPSSNPLPPPPRPSKHQFQPPS